LAEEKKTQQANKPTGPQAKAPAPQQRPGMPTIRKAKNVDRETKDFRGIVRLVGKDLDGHDEVHQALKKVRGIGTNFAVNLSRIVQGKFSISPNELIGNLSEEQLEKIEDVMKNPLRYGIKKFMLNRPDDYFDGQSKHLVGTDLVFATKQDIGLQKQIRTYIGWRHSLGQKVRGQHNRSTGRAGMSVGVMKKALKAASKPGTAAPAAAEKK
jgi:small subunit ribosomal protein S13